MQWSVLFPFSGIKQQLYLAGKIKKQNRPQDVKRR